LSPTDQNRPSRAYYALAVLPGVLAVVAFFWILFASLRSLTTNLTRVVFPGENSVQLTHIGLQTVFYEYESHAGNRSFHTSSDLEKMHCTLVNPVTGVNVPLRTPRAHTTYTLTGHYSGYSVLEFRLERPGEYDFTCNYTDQSEGQQVVFAVGPDNTGDIFKMVFVEIFVLFLGLGAGAAAIALVYRKRNLSLGSPRIQSSTRREESSSTPFSD
jgi:hypothetical protein